MKTKICICGQKLIDKHIKEKEQDFKEWKNIKKNILNKSVLKLVLDSELIKERMFKLINLISELYDEAHEIASEMSDLEGDADWILFNLDDLMKIILKQEQEGEK